MDHTPPPPPPEDQDSEQQQLCDTLQDLHVCPGDIQQWGVDWFFERLPHMNVTWPRKTRVDLYGFVPDFSKIPECVRPHLICA
jgi:hypothetical protein